MSNAILAAKDDDGMCPFYPKGRLKRDEGQDSYIYMFLNSILDGRGPAENVLLSNLEYTLLRKRQPGRNLNLGSPVYLTGFINLSAGKNSLLPVWEKDTD
ncbi:hypothetical protein AVEN_106986-1 [Araneus ventricosus]|uniref:Uncharacterized protein n=1 Tax=Araneus ventricosus TaxID=182803 RepID=A0A4Y2UVG3_ARAVE|nr:hypothetical protein AVEN_106986-1 [Araneus ventricosus]